MIIKTRVFECDNNGYKNLAQLAQAMEISVSQIYRVREGKRHINHKFIVGAIKAFPNSKLNDLFYLAHESSRMSPGKVRHSSPENNGYVTNQSSAL
ncbi:hypothetical protein ACFLUU_03790 [Chloroflexota bacterium]